MLTFRDGPVRAIGEAMLEVAPQGDGAYRLGYAGDTFNTAWHMAQLLPGRSVGMVTRLGTDSLSDRFAQAMADDGLAINGISRDPERRMGLYLIELEGAERSFHYWRDSSAARGLADDPARLDAALTDAALIHLSGITLAILPAAARETLFAALTAARLAGARIVFDPNIRPRLWSSMSEAQAVIGRMLQMTDIALPSLDDELAHFGDADAAAVLTRMAAAGVAEIVVKDGPGAVHLRTDEGDAVLPTPAAAGVVDTTGAGDAFNAGYLSARLAGQAPREAVRLGQAMAAEVLRRYGARADRATAAALAPQIRGGG